MQLSERPYSVCLCLSPENIEIRSRIIKYFEFHLHNEDHTQQEIYPPSSKFS